MLSFSTTFKKPSGLSFRGLFFYLFLSSFLLLHSSTLHLSITSNPSRINPILATDSASSTVSDWIFESLVKYDKDGKIVGDIAKSFEFLSPTTILFEIDKNKKWSDGVAITSKDVKFTLEQIRSPKNFTPYASNFRYVDSVEIISDTKFKVHYKSSYFKALECWTMGLLPHHKLKDEESLMKSSFNKSPIGNGTYTLSQFEASKNIILKSSKNHYPKVANIDEIVYHFVPDSSTSFSMLKLGELDIGSLSPIQIDRQLDENFHKQFQIIEQPSFSYTYMGFNLRRDIFKNPKIREVISLGIDREEIVNLLFFGHAKVCNGPFLPGTYAYNDEVKSIKQNIQKAKKLLQELGYNENNKFEFEVVTNANNSIRLYAAQIMQQQLSKIDVVMKIRVLEWQAFLNTVVHPRNFDAVLLGWSLSLMPDAYSIWHSESDVKGGFNLVGYRNSDVDSMIKEAEKSIDNKKIAKLYKDIFAQIVKDNPYLFLYIPNSITAVKKSISPIEPSLTGIMHNQVDWIKE